MTMMQVVGPLYCPDCKPVYTKGEGAKFRRRCNGQLQLSEGNYSGTGVDMVYCPDCGHGFSISYKVAAIDRAEDWDRDFKAEKAYEIERKEQFSKELAETVIETAAELAAMRQRFEEEFGKP